MRSNNAGPWGLIVLGVVLLNVAMRMPAPAAPASATGDLLVAFAQLVSAGGGVTSLVIGVRRLLRNR